MTFRAYWSQLFCFCFIDVATRYLQHTVDIISGIPAGLGHLSQLVRTCRILQLHRYLLWVLPVLWSLWKQKPVLKYRLVAQYVNVVFFMICDWKSCSRHCVRCREDIKNWLNLWIWIYLKIYYIGLISMEIKNEEPFLESCLGNGTNTREM